MLMSLRQMSVVDASTTCFRVSRLPSSHGLCVRSWHTSAAARSKPGHSVGKAHAKPSGKSNDTTKDANERKGYWTLQQPHDTLLEAKKSKFFATAWPVTSAAAAMQHVADASDASASHNCFAYKIGNECRCSDDGEPSGTAGRPMLAAIESEGLDEVCVLVTRFFGGTKLGTGGLTRAYGGAARLCLQESDRVFMDAKAVLAFEVPFDATGAVFNLIDQAKAERLAEDYSADGSLQLKVSILETEAAQLVDNLRNATAGRVQARVTTALTDA